MNREIGGRDTGDGRRWRRGGGRGEDHLARGNGKGGGGHGERGGEYADREIDGSYAANSGGGRKRERECWREERATSSCGHCARAGRPASLLPPVCLAGTTRNLAVPWCEYSRCTGMRGRATCFFFSIFLLCALTIVVRSFSRSRV